MRLGGRWRHEEMAESDGVGCDRVDSFVAEPIIAWDYEPRSGNRRDATLCSVAAHRGSSASSLALLRYSRANSFPISLASA